MDSQFQSQPSALEELAAHQGYKDHYDYYSPDEEFDSGFNSQDQPPPASSKPRPVLVGEQSDGVNVLAELLGFVRKYHKILYLVIPVPLFAGLVIMTIAGAGKQNEQGAMQVVTPLAPGVQQQQLQQAVNIINEVPLQDPTTGQARQATAQEMIQAAKLVMSYQENENIQQAVNQLQVQISIGIGTVGHPCYQMTMQTCIDQKLQPDVDQRRATALGSGNMDEVLLTDQLNRVYDRLREGNTRPANFFPQTYTLARAKYWSALQILASQTPNGQSAAILQQSQQPPVIGGGMTYNPQTGQMQSNQ